MALLDWDSLLDRFNGEDVEESELFVPADDLCDLPWFFEGETCSSGMTQSSKQSSHGGERDVGFFRQVPGKPRSKRAGGRTWSMDSPLPLGGGSTVLPVKRCCSHCRAEKTPQWRAGPLGPKTLCNACGVRYRSGRLVPEYRPAASPTFESDIHSNSHKRIMKMRSEKSTVVFDD